MDIVVESSEYDEVVVYECAEDYIEVDSGGEHMNVKKGALMTVLGKGAFFPTALLYRARPFCYLITQLFVKEVSVYI